MEFMSYYSKYAIFSGVYWSPCRITESMWNYRVHMESTWSLWGRIKYMEFLMLGLAGVVVILSLLLREQYLGSKLCPTLYPLVSLLVYWDPRFLFLILQKN
jgi:hypothetical protein